MTMSSSQALARIRAVCLYRNLLRTSSSFRDYSLRNYASRRVKEEFRENRNASESESASLLSSGEEQLALMQRQLTISNMYAQNTSVMEIAAAAVSRG